MARRQAALATYRADTTWEAHGSRVADHFLDAAASQCLPAMAAAEQVGECATRAALRAVRNGRGADGTRERDYTRHPGLCQETEVDAEGNCSAPGATGRPSQQMLGSWALGNRTQLHTLGDCMRACRCCASCRFVSYSAHPKHRECSWYSHCNLAQLNQGGRDYVTVQVRRRGGMPSLVGGGRRGGGGGGGGGGRGGGGGGGGRGGGGGGGRRVRTASALVASLPSPPPGLAGACGQVDGYHMDCDSGSKGSWQLSHTEVSSWGQANQACAAKCAGCRSCKFFSFSLRHRDCSWFAACDTLSGAVPGFRTLPRSGDWGLPPADALLSRPPSRASIVFCAVVRHTQGASLYSLLSLLSIAIATKRVLGTNATVTVRVPTAPHGLRLDMPFASGALSALGHTTGVSILAAEHGGVSECDAPAADVLIFKEVALSTHLRAAGRAHDKLLERDSVGTLYAKGKLRELASGQFVNELLADFWSFLRQLPEASPLVVVAPWRGSAEHGASGDGTRRAGGAVHVVLHLMQGPTVQQARAGMLQHASAALHAEALLAVQTLQLATPMHGESLLTPPCAYLFLREPVDAGRWVVFTRGAANCSTPSNHLGRDRTAPFRVRALAATVLPLVRAAKLSCLRVNAQVDPKHKRRFLAEFAAEDATTLRRDPSDAGATSTPLVVVELANLEQGCKSIHTGAPGHEGAHAGDACEASVQGHRKRRMALLPQQIEEHSRAALAPLLITEFGTHYTDWALARRAVDGLPSVRLEHRGVELGRPLELRAHTCDATSCRGCTFYRGHCVRGWLPCMAAERAK